LEPTSTLGYCVDVGSNTNINTNTVCVNHTKTFYNNIQNFPTIVYYSSMERFFSKKTVNKSEDVKGDKGDKGGVKREDVPKNMIMSTTKTESIPITPSSSFPSSGYGSRNDTRLTSYNDILERNHIANEIRGILASFDENCRNLHFKKGIFIYGSPGCGKTQFVQHLLESMNYDIIKYDAGDVRNKALIDTITCNNVSNRNVLAMMNRKSKPLAIVMDEIDEMNNGDKRGITSLIKLIRQKKTKKQKMEHVTLNPIICIGNYYVDKKMKELKKVCNVFELKTPTRSHMSQILQHILKGRAVTQDVQETILDFVQGDLRKFVFIENMYRKCPHFLEDRSILENIFQIKTYNDDAKKITHRLINNYVPLEQHNQILNETDRTIISLLYHENIVDTFHSQTFPIAFYTEFLRNLCFADAIDRITFQNQIWIFNEMSSIIKTFYNNWLYHQQFPEKKNTFYPDEIRFTKVLTKYSTEYNNSVFLFNMSQELDMDKKDVIAFFQELRLLLGGDDVPKDKSGETDGHPRGKKHERGVFAQDANINTDKMHEEYGVQGKKTSSHGVSGSTVLSGCSRSLYDHLDELFQSTEINRLDIKRMYRFLDKNSDTFDLIGGKRVTAASLPNSLEDAEGGEGEEEGGGDETED